MRLTVRALLLLLAAPLAPATPLASAAPGDDVVQFLDGVERVGRPGAPGALAVFGRDAFAVLTGDRTSPRAVVAAARHGKGRVVAFAHNGYLSAPFLATDAGAARLVTNAIRWAGAVGSADSGSKVRVGMVTPDEPLAAHLSKAGFDVDRGAAPKSRVRIVTDIDAVDDAAAAKLEQFVIEGGAIIAAVCPWGWEQVHASRGLSLRSDSPLNRILARAGLAFADGIPDATARGADAFDITASRPADVHAGHALDALGDKSAHFSPDIVADALRAVPPGEDDFLPRVQAIASKVPAKDFPRPGRPLGRAPGDDQRTRIAVAWRTITWTDLPPDQVVAAPGSEDFPGTVTASAARPNVTLTLDPKEPGWRSTGLYALPGEVITFAPRSATTGAHATPPAWRIRIGCHTDALWDHDTWPRWPEISHATLLREGPTSVATPWGGAIYLEPLAAAAPIVVDVRGAVEAPLFDVRDAGRVKSWPSRRRAPAPWAELAGEHMILSLPSSAVRELDDPEALVRWWDSVLVSHCALAGTPVPPRPERFVCDAEISVGYMHSGYPIMMHLDVGTPTSGRPAHLVDLATLRTEGTWGPFHELGHNRQREWWTFDGTGEVTCNLFSLFSNEKIAGVFAWNNPWLEGQKAAAAAYLKRPDFGNWKANPGVALTTYAVVQRTFGWEPIQRVFAEMESLPEADRPTRNQDKIDQFVLRLSRACGKDLRPYFKRWAWPLSDAASRDAAAGRLPVWEPDLAFVKPGAK
ncbi:MAG: M60 family metallopeptidase [Planctomycetes bacterium]|nr:M60 family metallopeptidase [Planctomycetota bacterium]